MSDSEDALINFRDDSNVQEEVKRKCKELGMSRTELYRQAARRFLGEDGLDSPESMLARADELEVEASADEEEADDLETRAKLKRNEADRKRRRAEELREEAEHSDTYENSVEELAEWLSSDDARRFFPDHARVIAVASEHNVPVTRVLSDVQDFAGLPDARFQPLDGGDGGVA